MIQWQNLWIIELIWVNLSKSGNNSFSHLYRIICIYFLFINTIIVFYAIKCENKIKHKNKFWYNKLKPTILNDDIIKLL